MYQSVLTFYLNIFITLGQNLLNVMKKKENKEIMYELMDNLKIYTTEIIVVNYTRSSSLFFRNCVYQGKKSFER